MKELLNPSRFIAIYVEDSYNLAFNELITTHFDAISKQLLEADIQFIYLPYVLQHTDIRNIIEYNRPQLSQEFNKLSISDIYQQLKSDLPLPFQGEGLIWTENRPHKQLKSFILNAQDLLLTQFNKFTWLVTEQTTALDWFDQLVKDSTDNEIFSLQENEFESLQENEIDCLPDSEFYSLSDKKYESFQEYEFECFSDPAFQFETETVELANEIREKISKLEEKGALYLLGNILEKVLVKKPRLSTLFITNDFRIFLKDYEMREVKMAPLSKALYVLFLRHPEGIKFKNLIDYHDELLSIYKNVTTHENIGRAMARITALTDPLNNSVNEKCSRIRAAFVEVIADELAQYYYVMGYKGEAKTIRLDRSLVVYQ